MLESDQLENLYGELFQLMVRLPEEWKLFQDAANLLKKVQLMMNRIKNDEVEYNEEMVINCVITKKRSNTFTTLPIKGQGTKPALLLALVHCHTSKNLHEIFIVKQWPPQLINVFCKVLQQEAVPEIIATTLDDPRLNPAAQDYDATKEARSESNDILHHTETDLEGTFPIRLLSTYQIPSDKSNMRVAHQYLHLIEEAAGGRSGKRLRINEIIEPLSEELDQHTVNFLNLLTFLGGPDVHRSMLERATRPRKFFDSTGRVDLLPAPKLGPFFTSEAALNSCLESLMTRGFLHNNELGRKVSITSEFRTRECQKGIEGFISRIKAKWSALELVVHVFPIDSDLEAGIFGEAGRLLLPNVYHVITYLDRLDLECFSSSEIRQILRSCLSWSEFGDIPWKLQVLGEIVKLEKFLDSGEKAQVLAGKIQLRRKALARLYPQNFKLEKAPLNDICPLVNNPSSNAHYGEIILFKAQLLIDRDQLPDVFRVLRKFQPLVSHQNSTEEVRIQEHVARLRQKVYHFAGDFQAAIRCFEEASKHCVSKQVIPHLATDAVAVYCELGETQKTWKLLPQADYTGMAWQDLGKIGRGFSLAVAAVYLTEGFELLGGCRLEDSLSTFRKAKRIYEDLSKDYISSNPGLGVSTRQFSASVGLAMIAHIECNLGATNDWSVVLDYWQSTLRLAERLKNFFNKDQTFLEMIVLCSMSNVLACLGRMIEAHAIHSRSNILYKKTGRSFHFVALGSKWFDLLGDWNERNGLGRISELNFAQYCSLQKETGYPDTEGSIRLCR